MDLITVKLTLAMAVLNGSLDVTKNDVAWLQAPLTAVVTLLEIGEDRELHNMFADYIPEEDFQEALGQLRERRRNMVDYPRLMNHEDWGTTESELAKNIEVNRKYKIHLEELKAYLPPHRCNEIDAAIVESLKIYRMLDLLKCGLSDNYYVSVRREWFNELRTEMGDEAFYSRRQIPAVPYWRIQIAD